MTPLPYKLLLIFSAILIVGGALILAEAILSIFRGGWEADSVKFAAFGLFVLVMGDIQRRFVRYRIRRILEVTHQANSEKTGDSESETVKGRPEGE